MTSGVEATTHIVDKDVPKDNFWEEGQYKYSVIRIDNGLKQCEEFMAFIKDRAYVEEQYSKGLIEWSAKHYKIIEKGTAYNTVKTAWLDTLKEAERVAKLHFTMKEKLLAGPYEKVKKWKKQNYHSAALLGIKESKMFAQEFYLTQKPWMKKCKKVNQVRKRYLHHAREAHSAITQTETSANNAILAPEKLARAQGYASQKTLEKTKIRTKYKDLLHDLEQAKDHYIQSMERIFKKCQDLEEKRLEFFKKMFLEMHTILDLSANPSFQQIFSDVRNLIYRASAQEDVKWWWTNQGPGMAFYAPEFQEYDPKNPYANKHILKGFERTAVAFQSKLPPGVDRDSRIKNILSKPTSDPWKERDGRAHEDTLATQDQEFPIQDFSAAEPFPESATFGVLHQSKDFLDSMLLADINLEVTPTHAPWQDFASDNDSAVTPGDGILVCAVFSYEGLEDDELTFRKDEMFHMIEPEDEQGWCKGRLKSGTVGLYPANYVKVVESSISRSDNILAEFGL